MSDQPIHRAPPPRTKAPPEDTARYEAWLAKRGKAAGTRAANDKAREDVQLRLGDWGFFEHGIKIGDAQDRAGLDRADHAVLPSDKEDKGDWHAFLSTQGLAAGDALKRAAWLFRAGPVEPSRDPKVTAPTLTTAADGTVTLQGWILFPPAGRATKLTVIATPKGAKLTNQ